MNQHPRKWLYVTVFSILIVGGYSVFQNYNIEQTASLGKIKATTIAVCKYTDNPWVRVTAPNGGQTFSGGQQINVTWQSCKVHPSTPMYIDIVSTNPASPAFGGKELAYSLSNDGTETVTLPTNLGGSDFKMKIYPANQTNLTVVDMSDNFFTILIPSGISNTQWSSSVNSNGNGTGSGVIDFAFTITAEDADVAVAIADVVAHDTITKSAGAIVSAPTVVKISGDASGTMNNYMVSEGDTARFRVRYALSGPSGNYATVAITSIAGQPIPSAQQTSPTVIIP